VTVDVDAGSGWPLVSITLPAATHFLGRLRTSTLYSNSQPVHVSFSPAYEGNAFYTRRVVSQTKKNRQKLEQNICRTRPTYCAAIRLELGNDDPNPFDLKIGTPASPPPRNVHTNCGFFGAFDSRVRIDRRTDGRTDGRARHVMRPIRI